MDRASELGGSVPGSKYASKLSIDAAAAASAGGVYWRVAAELAGTSPAGGSGKSRLRV